MFEQLQKLGFVNSEKNAVIEKFMKLFLEYNKKVNLISKKDSEFLFEKHIYDSLAFNLFYQKYYYDGKTIKLLDIGTGGGFPSIPISIMNENINVFAVDSTLKKIKFIEYIVSIFGLKNIHPICKRAEDLLFKSEFEVCVSRAMAELRIILEYALPYIKEGGFFVAYKSLKAEEEIKNAQNALKILNAEIKEIMEYSLPLQESNKRVLIIIRKNGKTPNIYPRKNGFITKHPL